MTEKFGRLTYVGPDPLNKKNSIWDCDCGEKNISRNTKNVKGGYVKSCGCIRKETCAKKLDNLVGKRFGLLVVIKRGPNIVRVNGQIRVTWICKCDCGNETEPLPSDSLKSGGTTSCGCQHYKTGEDHWWFKHGLRYHPLYNRFCHIVERCYKKTHKNYKNYGAKGVRVHQPWLDDRSLFIEYIEELYPNAYDLIEQGIDQIDRFPDKEGNYEPGNIRLADAITNCNNKTNNRLITAFGITDTLANMVRKFAVVPYGSVKYRIDNHWHPEKALKILYYKNGDRPKDFDKPYSIEDYPSLGIDI